MRAAKAPVAAQPGSPASQAPTFPITLAARGAVAVRRAPHTRPLLFVASCPICGRQRFQWRSGEMRGWIGTPPENSPSLRGASCRDVSPHQPVEWHGVLMLGPPKHASFKQGGAHSPAQSQRLFRDAALVPNLAKKGQNHGPANTCKMWLSQHRAQIDRNRAIIFRMLPKVLKYGLTGLDQFRVSRLFRACQRFSTWNVAHVARTISEP